MQRHSPLNFCVPQMRFAGSHASPPRPPHEPRIIRQLRTAEQQWAADATVQRLYYDAVQERQDTGSAFVLAPIVFLFNRTDYLTLHWTQRGFWRFRMFSMYVDVTPCFLFTLHFLFRFPCLISLQFFYLIIYCALART